MSERRLVRYRPLALLGAMAVGLGLVQTLDAADLPRRNLGGTPYRSPYRYDEGAVARDDSPASYHGYYGYYGYDIGLVPYEGLYSATVTCLRSVRTRYGYVTVDVCDR